MIKIFSFTLVFYFLFSLYDNIRQRDALPERREQEWAAQWAGAG
jgi:hypothetical protein